MRKKHRNRGLAILAVVGLTMISSAVAEMAEVSYTWSRLAVDGGGYVTSLAIDLANPDTVYCGSDKGGVHRSDDGGQHWTICTNGFDRETFYAISGILVDDWTPGRVYMANGIGDTRSATWWIKGGVWRSDDKGENWRVLTQNFYFSGEGDGKHAGHVLTFDPTNHNVIYAASFNDGLWRTRTAGSTWSRIAMAGRYLTGVWVDPDNASRILVAARTDLYGDDPVAGGLFESINGGTTWTKILDVASVTDFTRNDNNHDLLAAACNGNSVYISTNRGQSWTQIALHAACTRVNKVRWHPGYPQRLWTAGGNSGLFYTDDLGASWNWPMADRETSLTWPTDWFLSAEHQSWNAMPSVYDLLIDPTRPERMYASDYFTAYRSTDGGAVWTAKPYGLNVTCAYQILCDPNEPQTIYTLQADVGLLKSTDSGASFLYPGNKTDNFCIQEIGQLWINPANSNHLIITQTIDWKDPHWARVGVSFDGGVNWNVYNNGLPWNVGGWLTGLAVLDTEGDEIMVAYSGSDTTNGGVYHTSNGGLYWSCCSTGLPTSNSLFGSTWGALPNLVCSGNRIYAATTLGAYRCSTTDFTWTRIGEGILPSELLTVAVDPNRTNRLWIGSSLGLYFSEDAGETWTLVSDATMRRCQSVAIDPFDSDRWLVAVSQPWWGTSPNIGGVYLTEDAGGSWSKLSGLPCEGMTWRVSFDPHRQGVVYVGCNGTGSWMGQKRLLLGGDADGDGKVDVGDLGILAANYGLTSGATWAQGDFNGDGKVDVGDLGILAANYGAGASGADFDADYAKVFCETTSNDDSSSEYIVDDVMGLCSSLGLPLILGLMLMGLVLVKLEE